MDLPIKIPSLPRSKSIWLKWPKIIAVKSNTYLEILHTLSLWWGYLWSLTLLQWTLKNDCSHVIKTVYSSRKNSFVDKVYNLFTNSCPQPCDTTRDELSLCSALANTHLGTTHSGIRTRFTLKWFSQYNPTSGRNRRPDRWNTPVGLEKTTPTHYL